MRITNISAINSTNTYVSNIKKLEKSFEHLSSGLRINKAADDPAGLAVSEKMRAQIKGLKQSSRNVQDGVSFVQTAEGYLKESTNILHRMRELSVQAANGTYTQEDRSQITVELDELSKELNRIHEDAKFNNVRIFDGKSLGENSFGKTDYDSISAARNDNFNKNNDYPEGLNGLVIQSGPNTDERVFIKMEEINTHSLGLTDKPVHTYRDLNQVENDNLAYREASFFDKSNDSIYKTTYLESQIAPAAYDTGDKELSFTYLTPSEGTRVNITTPEKATETITVIDVALNKVNRQRTDLGAYQNRLETIQRGIELTTENMQAAESRIRDADMAKESSAMAINNILAQTSASMTAQANGLSNNILRIIS